jgi:hypothetical protein
MVRLTCHCWGCPKIRMRSAKTRERKVSTFKYTDDARGDKKSPRDCSSLKSCESFYTCPRAPFYRETKGLTFRKYPRIQGIFLMWTHTWMFFTSHTFTSLPLVHTPNPDFLRQRLWLGFLLVRESPHSGNLHTPRLPNSNFSGFPNSVDSRFHGFADSWLQVFTGSRPQELRRSKASDLHRFATSELRRFKIRDLRKFATSELRRLKSPENSFHKFHKTRRFEGDRFSWIPQH